MPPKRGGGGGAPRSGGQAPGPHRRPHPGSPARDHVRLRLTAGSRFRLPPWVPLGCSGCTTTALPRMCRSPISSPPGSGRTRPTGNSRNCRRQGSVRAGWPIGSSVRGMTTAGPTAGLPSPPGGITSTPGSGTSGSTLSRGTGRPATIAKLRPPPGGRVDCPLPGGQRPPAEVSEDLTAGLAAADLDRLLTGTMFVAAGTIAQIRVETWRPGLAEPAATPVA